MLFMSTKIVTQMVSPLNLSLFLALVSGILIWRDRKTLGLVVLSFAIVWLWMWSTPVFTNPVRSMIEGKFPPVPVERMESADAIIVLGGGVSLARPPRIYAEVNAAGDRVLHAARLYKAGKAKWIIVSGGRAISSEEGTQTHASAMLALLKELGVPEEVVLMEDGSRNTRENARRTKRLLDDHGFEKILLVTSALHMPRALAEFRYICPHVYPAPTDFEIVTNRPRTVLDLMPSASALEGGSRAFKEILGSAVQTLTTRGSP